MGSTLSEGQSLLLAIVCAILFVLFDAARSLATQLGPMQLRRLSTERIAATPRLFHFTPGNFALITGTLVEIWLVGGIAFSTLALRSHGFAVAVGLSTLAWGVLVAVLKFGLAFVPDETAEVAVSAIIPLTHVFYFVLWPLLFPLRWASERVSSRRDEEVDEEEVTDEEVQAFIDVGEEEGILEEGDAELIQSVVEFGDRLAREVMTPRIDMIAFEVPGSLEDLARAFIESKYSRIPIYEDNIDNIVGIVHVKDLFEAIHLGHKKSVTEIARPAYRIAETKKVSDLLRELQHAHLQIAIVLDEYGGTAGLLTIEDVVEEIVGEIADEHEDVEEGLLPLEGGGWIVPGLTRVEELEELTGAALEGEDYETVAGLIFTQMGRVPKTGEKVQKDGLMFEIDRADRKRIYRVRVLPVPPSPEEQAEGAKGERA